MKVLAGVLTFIVKSFDVEELVWYIITNNLDMEYYPIVYEVIACIELIVVGELYSQLLSYKHCIDSSTMKVPIPTQILHHVVAFMETTIVFVVVAVTPTVLATIEATPTSTT